MWGLGRGDDMVTLDSDIMTIVKVTGIQELIIV